MSLAEWGLKRNCASCGARFYDMQRSPIACPKCGAAFQAPAPTSRPSGSGRGRGGGWGKRAESPTARDAQRFYWSTELRPEAADAEEREEAEPEVAEEADEDAEEQAGNEADREPADAPDAPAEKS